MIVGTAGTTGTRFNPLPPVETRGDRRENMNMNMKQRVSIRSPRRNEGRP